MAIDGTQSTPRSPSPEPTDSDRIAGLVELLQTRDWYAGRVTAHHVEPGQDATFARVAMAAPIKAALAAQGIDQLYAHQGTAIGAAREGQNVVCTTPAASGKSLTYTVPALERGLATGGRTLYLAPQRALINDQERMFQELVAAGSGSPMSDLEVAQYTGRLSRAEKQAVRARQPHVILTTPDMLNASLLPFARRLWAWLFQHLDLVVLDELHQYRGVFGSHVALVLRRLQRLCSAFGATPQFICCSATIGNPIAHAAAVSGQPRSTFTLVDEDASATGPTHWLFWQPPTSVPTDSSTGAHQAGDQRSHHVETARLFVELVSQGVQTLVFTRARQAAERYARLSGAFLHGRNRDDLAAQVTAYQGALPPDRRREIESGLADGSIRGAWSTMALELGVDIGGLDAVLLDGYPGTRMETGQRAGRAGRDDAPSLVALVAGGDPLDQTIMESPGELLNGPPERATVNPANPVLLRQHLPAAAAERPLSVDDVAWFGKAFSDAVTDLATPPNQALDREVTEQGIQWCLSDPEHPRAQHAISLRSIDDRTLTLSHSDTEAVLGELPFRDGLRDAHPGAIYFHQDDAYEVAALDLDRDRATLEQRETTRYTQALSETTIEVEDVLDTRSIGNRSGAAAQLATVTVHEQVIGYQRRIASTGTLETQAELSLPTTTLKTCALLLCVPTRITRRLRNREGDMAALSAMHAIEHVLRGLFPGELLCDRRDLRGVSTPDHPHTGRGTIVLYETHEGGVGLARGGFDQLDSLLEAARHRLAVCSCTDGCSACVQLAQCETGNVPLDKGLALELLEELRV